eukprot:COSAG06_NODE_45963_length_350_cov_5.191235_2_plen_52_part_01
MLPSLSPRLQLRLGIQHPPHCGSMALRRRQMQPRLVLNIYGEHIAAGLLQYI